MADFIDFMLRKTPRIFNAPLNYHCPKCGKDRVRRLTEVDHCLDCGWLVVYTPKRTIRWPHPPGDCPTCGCDLERNTFTDDCAMCGNVLRYE